MGLVDVYAAVIPDLPYQAGIHVNYQETKLRIKDGLPKMKDMPKEMGGSGIAVQLRGFGPLGLLAMAVIVLGDVIVRPRQAGIRVQPGSRRSDRARARVPPCAKHVDRRRRHDGGAAEKNGGGGDGWRHVFTLGSS